MCTSDFMPFLTQHHFPRLWDWFQNAVGGTHDKRRLCRRRFQGSGSVLEVGCATGNIAEAFADLLSLSYTGIDIDDKAIAFAQRRFRDDQRFRFIASDLREAFERSTRFDYILFGGCLHHMPDAMALELLRTAERHLPPSGQIVVVDPVVPRDSDPWLVRQFIRIERGECLRSGRAMVDLLGRVDTLELVHSEELLIGATPLSVPTCARFGVYELRRRESRAATQAPWPSATIRS